MNNQNSIALKSDMINICLQEGLGFIKTTIPKGSSVRSLIEEQQDLANCTFLVRHGPRSRTQIAGLYYTFHNGDYVSIVQDK